MLLEEDSFQFHRKQRKGTIYVNGVLGSLRWLILLHPTTILCKYFNILFCPVETHVNVKYNYITDISDFSWHHFDFSCRTRH